MTVTAIVQLTIFLGLVLGAVPLLSAWMLRVYGPGPAPLQRLLGPLERLLYRLAGVDPNDDQPWTRYASGVLFVSAVSVAVVYLLQRLQAFLPLNPQQFAGTTPDLSLNTAVSFATNTNWQSYGGETTYGTLVQMLGLGVQNFVSAAIGLGVLAALLRGFTRREATGIGNVWRDLVRGTVYLLLPLAIGLALLLVWQGVPQTFTALREVPMLDATHSGRATQLLAMGPVASQEAIKQLGTNGGGFFNVNSAHPFENPTPLANLLSLVSILLLPAACCDFFGRMVRDRRQGAALLAAMLVLFVPLALATIAAEAAPTTIAASVPGLDPSTLGNMEGKETRNGVVQTAIWAAATTAASNGSVNGMHDSFTPLGGLAPLWLMQLGEIVFGGVGSGLYGMLVFAIIAVFIAGLMVGRTPEYLGKKIDAREMRMAALVILIPSAVVLLGTALAVGTVLGRGTVLNTGAHGFSEMLYALSSAGNNNGSAFAGLTANTPFWNVLLAVAMWLGRVWVIIPVLALAGSLAAKRVTPPSAGTMPTDGPLFVTLVIGTIVLVGALTFLPALALGPVVEQIELLSAGGLHAR